MATNKEGWWDELRVFYEWFDAYGFRGVIIGGLTFLAGVGGVVTTVVSPAKYENAGEVIIMSLLLLALGVPLSALFCWDFRRYRARWRQDRFGGGKEANR